MPGGNPAPPVAAAAAPNPGSTSYTFRKSDLPLLDIEADRGPLFRAWKRRWLDYCLVSNLNNSPSTMKCTVLRQCMSPETLVILENLGVSTDEATPDDIITALTSYADRMLNVNMEWHKLTSRYQHDGEDINDFVMALRQIVKNCDTCDVACADRAVRVQLIRGVKDKSITEALLKIKKISLSDAIETAVALEEAQEGGRSLHEPPESTVGRLSAYRQQQKRPYLQGPSGRSVNRQGPPMMYQQQRVRPPTTLETPNRFYDARRQPSLPPPSSFVQTPNFPTNPNQNRACPNCGGRPHTRAPCPARLATCDFCGKQGHFKRVCRAAKVAAMSSHEQYHDGPMEDAWDQQQPLIEEQEALQTMFQSSCPNDSWDVPEESAEDSAQLYFVGTSGPMLQQDSSPRTHVKCSINGQSLSTVVLPDSGADISAASFDFVRQFGVTISDIQVNDRFVQSANGNRLPILGKIDVTWSDQGGRHHVQDQLYIMSGLQCPLLSWRVARDLHLIQFNFDRVNHIRIQPPQVQLRRRVPRRPLLPVTPRLAHARQRRGQHLAERLENQLKSEFKDVITDKLKVMKGEQFRIHLEDDAVPFRVSAPRTVPIAFKDKLKAELESLQKQGIIEPVTHPTDWCSPIVVEPKGEGVRLCVDFTKLNKFVKREFYATESPAKQVFDIVQSQAQYFTSMDATKGYHQCPLDPQDRDLTTFITPYGRFRYLRAPFGISSISEHYNRRMDEALKLRSTNSRRVVDDLALYDAQLIDHYHHVRDILLQCRNQGITLNPRKFKFGRPTITFAGYKISKQGYSIDPAVHSAIDSFPLPKNITDLRAFFGLVNQLTGMRSDISTLMEPLRPLLSTKNVFLWTPQHDEAFLRVKDKLRSSPTLAFFALDKPTRLLTDASRTGLGFILQQRHEDQWRVVYSGSRFLNDAEQRYAVVELELLAIAFAFKKCAHMLTAVPVTVFTDHKPLVPIINSKRLDEIENPRLQRMRFYLSQFQVHAEHLKGHDNTAADTLSRFPANPAPMVAAVMGSDGPALCPFQQWVARHMDADTHDLLRNFILDGFPTSKDSLPDHIRPFWIDRHDLWLHGDLIFKGSAIYIPPSCRASVLKQLHIAHQGERRTMALAKPLVYWPFLLRDVRNVVQACLLCVRYKDAPPKPPLCQPPLPVAPFQDVSIDVFQIGKTYYLAMVDAFSNWLDVARFSAMPSSNNIITFLSSQFAMFGSPQTLRSDNASLFKSAQFQSFLTNFNVTHVTSAPYYPQSNGRAENAVKVLKKMLKKIGNDSQSVAKALLMLRNTPNDDGCTPAFKVFGRQLRGPMSTSVGPHTFVTPPSERQRLLQHATERRHSIRQKAKQRYDANTRPVRLPPIGSQVAVRSPITNEFTTRAVVTSILSARRLLLRFHSDQSLHERDVRHVIPLVPALNANIPNHTQPWASPARPTSPQEPSGPNPSGPSLQGAPLRRSTRQRRAPARYHDFY